MIIQRKYMVNIRNLGLNISFGIKFKDDIYAKLHLKLWFNRILLNRNGFKSSCPEI